MDPKNKNLRDLEITMSSGKNVSSTQQLKGEAKDSLKGKNSMKAYETSGGVPKNNLGGENTNS